MATPLHSSDDAWYEQALDELESGQTVKAAWARALAEANGDDGKAKATYIRLRVAQLRSAQEPTHASQEQVEAKRLGNIAPINAPNRLNDTKYLGEFKDGKPHGKGTLTLPDGAKYLGEFMNGNFHGHGTEYGPDGSILRSGIWRNGVFIGR